MRNQTAEFCSSCHKVHLDVPVNHYRWIRGFNEYDNWQASGVSGQGARSFYYPPKPAQCADCHMPLTPSKDQGNINGFVHSHRFPAANTALPVANEDPEQLKITENFLKDKIVSVDIFALSPARSELKHAAFSQSELATTFAVGEEAEAKVTPAAEAEVLPVTAPLNRVQPVVRRGDTVRVDVVVRTKKIGHFFPGGTVDAYDTWLELKGTDDKGQTIFWSGMVEDNGKGPVEKGAHFYRSLQVDAHGNRINKRNAWATRAVVYVHLIPPGAADTAHYRLHIPENAGNKSRSMRACAIANFPGSTPNSLSPEFLIQLSPNRSHSRLRRHEVHVCGFPQRCLSKTRTNSRPSRGRVGRRRSYFERSVAQHARAASERNLASRRLAALERLRHRPAASG